VTIYEFFILYRNFYAFDNNILPARSFNTFDDEFGCVLRSNCQISLKFDLPAGLEKQINAEIDKIEKHNSDRASINN